MSPRTHPSQRFTGSWSTQALADKPPVVSSGATIFCQTPSSQQGLYRTYARRTTERIISPASEPDGIERNERSDC